MAKSKSKTPASDAPKPKGRPPGTGALHDGVGRLARFSVRVSQEELAVLTARAKAEGLPLGALVVRTLKQAGLIP